ncbi:Disease resistance protein RPM1 [Panicum miliaceum]|uniref:Disease resistance protein RPM1 n=1 Tax=Panicum miliaceum TaxID=4540 RepID=A0A3L6RKW5_PANMI|nr:Disease resistance protein RPM1 [Panicum miliaceum]
MGHGQNDLANRHGLIRRLSVHYIDQGQASVLANEDLSHVRSLTVTASACIKHLPSLVDFEALRVLDFQGCQNVQEYDMNDIDKLFQLKYLSFRDTDMRELPSGIVRLYSLETLDLSNTCIEELPPEIVQLIKLQHLLIARYYNMYSDRHFCLEGRTKIPDGIGNMRNLRVISGFNVTKSSLSAVKELGNLTALNELNLQLDGGGSQEYKRHEEMLLSSLCKLGGCKLQSLWIRAANSTPLQFLDSWSPLPSSLQRFRMIANYDFPEMPKWITPKLTRLAHLDINLVEITEEVLRILGEMRALLSLLLSFKGAQNERIIVRGHSFPCLKEFYLFISSSGTRPTYLKFEEGAMPKLEKLDVPFFVSVAKAYGFNLGINHLPCLKHADVILDNRHATSSESKAAAAAAIRNEANAHSNHPRVFIIGEMEEDAEGSYTDEEEG